MTTVGEWKALLRARLKTALSAREKHVVSVLRDVLAAIDNAEAPPVVTAAATEAPIAGGVSGLGAGEVQRLSLTPEAVLEIVEADLTERREAKAQYERLGRHEEAAVLATQVEVLAALVEANGTS